MHNRERIVSSINVVGKTGYPHVTQWNWTHIYTITHIIYHKINLKSFKDLNVRPETVKFLEENMEGKFHNIGFGNDFIDTIPKVRATKMNINKGMKVKVTQLCLTLCDPMDCGILQARILEWVPFPSPGDLPNPGIKPGSPTLQADSLPAEPQGRLR